MARLDEGRVSSGIEPGKSAAQHLDEQVTPLEIGAIDVGDFELATRRWLQASGDVENIVVVEIEAGDSHIRPWLARLLLDRQRAPALVELNHAVLLRRVDDVAENGCPG